MVEYECFRCGYITNLRGNLKHHLNRKNICKTIDEDISIELIKKHYGFDEPLQITPNHSKITPNCSKSLQNDPPNNSKSLQNWQKITPNNSKSLQNLNKQNICEFCEKSFSRKDNLTKHLKTCKKKKESESLILHQHSEFLEMKKEIEELKKYKTNIQNQNNTTNNINNGNIININNYGNENLNHLRTRDFLKLFDGIFGAVPKLIEKIHFDNKHPENKNIKYTNKKLPFIKVVKDNKWQLVNKKPELLDLIDSKCYMLKEKYYEIINKDNHNISDVQRSRIDSYFKKYQEDDKKVMLDLINRTELVLLNNSKKI